MMTAKQKEHWAIGGVIVLGIGAIAIAGSKGAESAPSGRMQKQPKEQYAPNPANANIAAAWLAAKSQLGTTYDQAETQDYAANQARLIAYNTNAAATKQVSLQTAADQAIAQAETAAEESVASTQASAEENVAQTQQPQWWQSLLGGVGGLFGGLGFSQPSFGGSSGGGLLGILQRFIPQFNPTSYGTGYWDSGEGLVDPNVDPYAAIDEVNP